MSVAVVVPVIIRIFLFIFILVFLIFLVRIHFEPALFHFQGEECQVLQLGRGPR